MAAKGAAIEDEVAAAQGAIGLLRGRVVAVEAVDSFYGSAAVGGIKQGAASGGGAEGEQDGAAAGAEEERAAAPQEENAGARAAAAVRRTAIVVEKLGATPAAYPRPPGTPNKKPL